MGSGFGKRLIGVVLGVILGLFVGVVVGPYVVHGLGGNRPPAKAFRFAGGF
jgi:hypothetical protein